MHDSEKSDSAIVAVKPPNKAGLPVAEAVERRAGAKGNADQQSTHRTQSRKRVTQALSRVRQAARHRKKERFTALLHHLNVDTLRTAFLALKRKAAPGVDGVTWQDYEADLEPNLEDLHREIHRGAYRPQPSRRTYIPKADGRQRPLGVAALEDKIVQGACVMVLNAIYEEDFLGFSYGFRPRRGPHDALDALSVAITSRKVNYVLDANVRDFFGSVSQDWLVSFLEHRVGDKRIIRLIRKWLKAGILEDGVVTVADSGTGQGAVISPLLGNIYLHYFFDLWAERWRRQEARGDVIVVRYADDLVAGFEHEDDARRFLDAMRERFAAFSLSLHPVKTRVIEFGRRAAVNRKNRGVSRPDTFAFLGFTFICSKSRRGFFQLQRKTRRDRMQTKLQEIKAELRRRMHQTIPDQGHWLRQVVTGHVAYYAVPTNSRSLSAFRHYLTDLWRRTLRRRSQKDGFTYSRESCLVLERGFLSYRLKLPCDRSAKDAWFGYSPVGALRKLPFILCSRPAEDWLQRSGSSLTVSPTTLFMAARGRRDCSCTSTRRGSRRDRVPTK